MAGQHTTEIKSEQHRFIFMVESCLVNIYHLSSEAGEVLIFVFIGKILTLTDCSLASHQHPCYVVITALAQWSHNSKTIKYRQLSDGQRDKTNYDGASLSPYQSYK